MASASWPGLTTMRSLAAVLHVVLVDHGYALEAAGQGLARHIEEIGQPGQAGGKRSG